MGMIVKQVHNGIDVLKPIGISRVSQLHVVIRPQASSQFSGGLGCAGCAGYLVSPADQRICQVTADGAVQPQYENPHGVTTACGL